MSFVPMITCDGLWPKPGRETCPAYLPLPAGDLDRARRYALDHGWVLAEAPDGPELCPAHRLARDEGRLDAEHRVVLP
jgi:hypothetical protein